MSEWFEHLNQNNCIKDAEAVGYIWQSRDSILLFMATKVIVPKVVLRQKGYGFIIKL